MRKYCLLLLVLMTLLTACLSKETPTIAPPVVVITSPANGQTIKQGVDVSINSTANDTQGIVRVELWVDGSLYRVDTSPEAGGQTTFVVSQPWHAAAAGGHKLVVKAYSSNGQTAESLPVNIEVQVSAATVPTDTLSPTSAPTGTPLPPPTDTPVPPLPTDMPTMLPQPTVTPLPPTLTPTSPPEPTDTPSPTGTPAWPAVPEPFAAVWNTLGGADGDLGEPIAEAVLNRWMADQFFEGGLALWRNNESDPADYVYALFYDEGDETRGTWLQFEDAWHEGLPQFSCPEAEANGDLGPRRGFGKVWCEEIKVHDGLGAPLVIEQGADAGLQDFERGTMLWAARLGHIYVFFEDKSWQRF